MAMSVIVPNVVRQMLQLEATVFLSTSGGKDSQVIVNQVSGVAAREKWPNRLELAWANLGRAEWKQTYAFVMREAAIAGRKLNIVSREKGDLVQRIEERMEQLDGQDKPFWPSSEARY